MARLAFSGPNFKNLASFQVGWPKRFELAFWPFFGLISSWMALKNSFGILALFWPFFAEIGSCERKYLYSIFSATQFEKFCDKCYIRPTPAF